MKHVWILACFTLVVCAVATPQVQAGGQFYGTFGGGYVYGGYAPHYGWGYPAVPTWSYPYSAYGYPFALPYGSPFVTYGGSLPIARIYPQPLFRGYTLYLPRTRVYPRPGPRYRGGYGGYVPRYYRRYR